MNRQEWLEYIAEERVRKSVKSMMKKKPNVVAFGSYVYVNGKCFNIDITQVESDLKGSKHESRT